MPELKKYKPEIEALAPKGVRVEIERGGAELGVGITEGTVRRVSVDVFGPKNTSRKIELAEKEQDVMVFEWTKRSKMMRVLENHALLKKWGLPTIPTMRVDESNPNFIYMTDLTRGGTVEVYSVPDWLEVDGRKGKLHASTKLITLSNAKELSVTIAELYRRTIQVGCRVNNCDILFLTVDATTREAKVLFGDLGGMDVVPPNSEYVVDQNCYDFWMFIEEMNTHLSTECQLSIGPINRIREELWKEIEEKRKTARRDSFNAE